MFSSIFLHSWFLTVKSERFRLWDDVSSLVFIAGVYVSLLPCSDTKEIRG